MRVSDNWGMNIYDHLFMIQKIEKLHWSRVRQS